VLIVKKKNNHTWFLNASKEKARVSEEESIIHNIVDSISSRRHKDLFDILSEIEQLSGWANAIEYLIRANGETYSYNMSSVGPKIRLEPLKYREVIFKLFRCEGFEPIAIDTSVLLEELSYETSIVDAMHSFSQRVEELTWIQIQKNDLLFFSPHYDNIWISNKLRNHILDFQKKEINNLVLCQIENRINIEPLWYSEFGRQALSSIGIQGLYISPDELSKVLSVIQVSPKPQPQILNVDECRPTQYKITAPSYHDYKLLLKSIVEKEIKTLSYLGSKHSIPTLNSLLYDTVKKYETQKSSNNYQKVLNMIFNHVIIRAIDSISILEQLSQLKDNRIATIAIIAMGNFFHESAASALINLICNKKNNEVIQTSLYQL
jgi:hypothetical protein